MKCLYKYPQQAFPYDQLVEENQHRDYGKPEFELLDTGVFDENRYFDVFVEYAKDSAEDILVQISVSNRAPEEKTLHLLPSLWFRNTWSWQDGRAKPSLKKLKVDNNLSVIEASHKILGERWLYCEEPTELLFTENETNKERLFGGSNTSPYVKDGINDYIVHGNKETVNPAQIGTKVAAHYVLNVGAGETKIVRVRLSDSPDLAAPFGANFETIFQNRLREADEFYARICPPNLLTEDSRNVQRQAFAGLLWSKQFYFYVVYDWLKGDPAGPPPPESRLGVRNQEWIHMFNNDVISMPDKWEYPW